MLCVTWDTGGCGRVKTIRPAAAGIGAISSDVISGKTQCRWLTPGTVTASSSDNGDVQPLWRPGQAACPYRHRRWTGTANTPIPPLVSSNRDRTWESWPLQLWPSLMVRMFYVRFLHLIVYCCLFRVFIICPECCKRADSWCLKSLQLDPWSWILTPGRKQ